MLSSPPPNGASQPDAAEVRAQIERILASTLFQQAGSLCRFLRYVSEEALAGRGDDIKEYALGVSVFDRGESFDPKTDTIVRVQARRLRAKLDEYYAQPDRQDPILIELPRGSYHPVFRAVSFPDAPAAGAPETLAPRPFNWKSWLLWTAAGLAVLAIGIAMRPALLARFGHRSFSSIAVLPFENLSRNPSEEWFSDGMTETLITELSKVRGLKVISRTSVMPFKGAPRKSLKQIARDLGVDAVVEGSALHVGDRVRITAQLIQASSDTHLWGDDFDGDMNDVLSLQRSVARAIAHATGSALAADEPARSAATRTADAQANQLYLRGLFELNHGNEEGLRKGIDYFEQALARRPDYPEVYAGIAYAWTQLSSFYLPPNEAMPKAKTAALKALELNPSLPEAHTTLGVIKLYYDWDWPAAERELTRALELNPSAADAYVLYEDYLLVMGQTDQAIVKAKKSIELDPLSVRVLMEAQFAFLLAEQYPQVVALGERIAALEPGVGTSHAYTSLAYTEQRNFPRALAEIDTAVRLEPTPLNKSFQAHVRARAGDKPGALQILDELKALNGKRYLCAYEVGSAYASVGNHEEALKYLENGTRQRADCMVWLRAEPWMKPLQKDPRFAKIARNIGLP